MYSEAWRYKMFVIVMLCTVFSLICTVFAVHGRCSIVHFVL